MSGTDLESECRWRLRTLEHRHLATHFDVTRVGGKPSLGKRTATPVSSPLRTAPRLGARQREAGGVREVPRVRQPVREQRRLEQPGVVVAHHLRRRNRRRSAARWCRLLAPNAWLVGNSTTNPASRAPPPRARQRSLSRLAGRFDRPVRVGATGRDCHAAPVTAQRVREPRQRRGTERSQARRDTRHHPSYGPTSTAPVH
jgi:hypothetical protein